MPALYSFDYVVIRAVPCIERGEFINAGVVLCCLEQAYLACRIRLNEARLLSLKPDADVELIRTHLAAFERICSGARDAGPIAKLSRSERFHWLAAPRSTMIQVSPTHSGLCELPAPMLDHLFQRLVEP